MAKGDAELVRKIKELVYSHTTAPDSELLGEIRELLSPPGGPVCPDCGHPLTFELPGRIWYHTKTGLQEPHVRPWLEGSRNYSNSVE